MTSTAQDLIQRLDELSEEDRAEVAAHLIQSLPIPDDEFDAAFLEELDRRESEILSGQEQGELVETVVARLKAKYL